MISQQKGADLSTTLPLGKKNNHYVRATGGAKKELSGIGGLMMSDHGQPIRAHPIGELGAADNRTANLRNSRIGLDHAGKFV